jgi:hypothetical protein
MTNMHPLKIILIGFLLVLVGVVIPFLMVLGIVQSSFPLGFFSFGASVAGLFLGLIGAAYYSRLDR